jgi:hypothetical protein
MAEYYHMHALIATTVDGTCKSAGTPQHVTVCSKMGFTHANEVRCELRPGTVPPNAACKCVHEIPDGARVPSGFRMVPKAEQRRWKKGAKGKRKKSGARKSEHIRQ